MILRSFMCPDCGYRMDVELRSDQWQEPPPECPRCDAATHQEFKPPAIIGSNIARATAIAHEIAATDYNVADIQSPSRSGRSVRYKDSVDGVPASTWGMQQGALQQAIAIGRETRIKHGSGLDVLQGALKSGAQPDLIEASKRKSYRVY